jgi:hypothetical protein
VFGDPIALRVADTEERKEEKAQNWFVGATRGYIKVNQNESDECPDIFGTNVTHYIEHSYEYFY